MVDMKLDIKLDWEGIYLQEEGLVLNYYYYIIVLLL
jgi:hypothetical protein